MLAERVTALAAELRRGKIPEEPTAVTTCCWMAHALLVVGEREPARDLAHLLARAVERGSLRSEAATSLSVLLARLEAWIGDTEWTGRYALALGLLPPSGEPPPLGALLDDVGPAGATEDSAGRAAGLLHGVVYGMWGASPEAVSARLRLAPRLPSGWSGCALQGVRVGPTTLDLALRVRPDALVLRISRVQGPPIGIAAEPPGLAGQAGAMVDDQALGTGAVRFEAHGDHEVVWPIS